ncbi:MAG: uncharacterized protein QOH39_2401 [Verrucomicrobiota bacterium]|jgi:uncharacterized protein YwgA
MNPYDIVHLTLHAFGGCIEGRTKLQKSVYFVGIITDSLVDLGYRPHFYGPYSDLVTAAVARLKSLGFVTESALGSGAIGDGGFEIARHDFQLTTEGQRIAKEKAEQNAEVWSKIKDAVNRVKSAGSIDYMRMSVAAKTYHMLKAKGKPATPEELSESAKALGWEAKPHDIEQSISFLQKLGLVSIKT